MIAWPDVIKVVVTAVDITNGQRFEPSCCPIARAITRSGLPIGPGEFGVNRKHVYHGFLEEVVYVLPSRAAAWVDRYDQGAESKPLTFTLRRGEP